MKTPIYRDFSTSYSFLFPRCAMEAEPEKKATWIKPTYSPWGIDTSSFDLYVHFIEKFLESVLPQSLLSALYARKEREEIANNLLFLSKTLPVLVGNHPEDTPSTFCITLLCSAEYTNGVGLYLSDALTRWLVPGKFLNISSVHSLNFKFISCPEEKFFFYQILLDIDTPQELLIVQNNWHNLRQEIRLSILAVRHARHIISAKQLSSEQKKAIIEENMASIIDSSPQNLNDNVFNHMHHFLLQLSAEDKIKQIKEQISIFLAQRPKIFDQEIFQEIKRSFLLFGDKFTALRDIRHVSRLMSFLCLFRKTLRHQVISFPNERHLTLKFLKTQLSLPSSQNENKTVLGIVGGVNVLRENELFEERHILEAMSHCMPKVRHIEKSLVLDRRSHDPIRLFYLEIEKKDGTPFSLKEIKELKRELPRELKESVENVLYPVLMPRNEEEIMRNILLLSQQLKFINDLPQVIISFNAQTEKELLFTVILLRLVKKKDPPIKELLEEIECDIKVNELETKKVGLLRKKHPKEANVFKVSLNKKNFLRKDFTIDLFKARQAVSNALNKCLEGIRDFNGGILSKQQEVFQELRSLINGKSADRDFLLENFFYSLTPPLRQTLIPPMFLKSLFSLMEEALEVDYKREPFSFKALLEQDQLLVMAASAQASLKDELFSLVTKLQIPASELSYTHVNVYGVHCVGYLYQNQDPNIRNLFYSKLLSGLQEWKSRLTHSKERKGAQGEAPDGSRGL